MSTHVRKVKSKKIRATTIVIVASMGLFLVPLLPAWASANYLGQWNDNARTISFGSSVAATWQLSSGSGTAKISDTRFIESSTPFGSIFGSTRSNQNGGYLQVAGTPSTVLTITFSSPGPAGSLGFAISDVDADLVKVTAFDSDNSPLSAAQIIGTATEVAFNYCGATNAPTTPNCYFADNAVPSVTSSGNEVQVSRSSDPSENGSTAWFRPNVEVSRVVFTQINGNLEYWFAQSIDETPGTPGTPAATAGIGQATVQITPPTSGDDPVTYTVTSSPGGATCTITVPATSCNVTGLTNGTPYTFSSTATNTGGTSAASASSNSVTPNDPAPGAPGTPTATAGNGQATVQISAPTSGGSPVSYAVTTSPGGATCFITAPAMSCTVTGLTNGTTYTFSSTATNAGGTSASSASSSPVTPSTPASTTPASTTPAVKLATTGASAAWLVLATSLALIAGSGLLTFSRRKRTW